VSDWKRIKAEYVAGGTSYRKLAEKYDVSFSTLRKVAAKEKWTELRDRAGAKTDTKIVDSVSEKNANRASKIISVADKLLDKISEIIDDVVTDTQSIKHLTSALKDLKEIKGFKSDADMREQEARIAKLEKEAEENNPDTQKDIVVRIEGGVNDAWQK
jgi:transposase-like protein